MAENSIFIVAATVLSIFDISRPSDGKLEPEFVQKLIR